MVQKKPTRNGTEKSTKIPCINAIITYSDPVDLMITGKVLSIDVAPAQQIGASLPKYRTRNGVNTSTVTSRIIFDIKATTPKSVPLYPVIRILERE